MSYVIEQVPEDSPRGKGGFVVESMPEAPGAERAAGLGARSIAKGVLSLPTMAMDAGIGLGNMINRGTNALGLTDAAPFPSASELTDRALDAMGLPRPASAAERVAGDMTSAATGGGATARFLASQAGKAATPVAEAVLSRLAAAPGAQAVAGATGAGAAGAAAESGADPMTQLLAGLAGATAPGAITAGAQAGVRGAIRGGEAGRQRYETRLSDFEQAGVEPTVGQAAGNRRMLGVEGTLAKVPGGAGPMTAAAEREAQQMRTRVDEISRELSPGATASTAGRTVEKGLERFMDRFRGEQQFLYEKLDKFIPAASRVSASNVASKLDDLIQPIPGAEHLSAGMTNPTIAKMRQLLQADTQDGTLPYEGLKRLRSVVGEKIANPKLTDDIGTAQWKQLYGALSEDMATAARNAGPDAERAFNRANWFTRAGHERIDSVLNRVSGKDSAERVFQAAVSPSEIKEGASTINAVFRSLSPSERKVVSSAVIRRLGQAAPSGQDAAGETFSANTFLTNWNKISPEAKMALFSDKESRQGLESLALAAERIKEGSQVFSNPSGTARAGPQIGTYGGLGASVVTGNLGTAGAIVSGILASNAGAKLLTNPQFVRWVGKTTQMPPELLPTQLQFLARQAEKWPREDQNAVQEMLRSVSP